MRLTHTASFLVMGFLFLSASASAQDRPSNWQIRFDRPDTPETEVTFVSMEPGFHITTGPAGIYFNPSNAATGNYRVESTIHLFDTGGRNREAFGIFVGGTDLNGGSQAYTYFLIRNDGHFLIKARSGAETRTIVDWMAFEGIDVHPGGDGTADNTLAIEVVGDAVTFYINGEEMASFPTAAMQTSGVAGIRVNHSLNIHVRSFSVRGAS